MALRGAPSRTVRASIESRSTIQLIETNGYKGTVNLSWLLTKWCLRCLLLVMCTHPFAKKALTLHLARSEGRERYFDRNLTLIANKSKTPRQVRDLQIAAECPSFWTFGGRCGPRYERVVPLWK